MRRLHRLAFRAPPHGGACLAGWTAPAGGSDSWPLFGVRLSADSRSGPLSDPSGACRRCTKASPWVALWPAPQGRAPNSEAAHRPSVPASMRAGGRPSRRVCGPSHRSSPAESLARKLAESWQSRPCRGGDRGACGVVPAPAWPAVWSRRRAASRPFRILPGSSVDSVGTQRFGLAGRLSRKIRSLQRLTLCTGMLNRRFSRPTLATHWRSLWCC